MRNGSGVGVVVAAGVAELRPGVSTVHFQNVTRSFDFSLVGCRLLQIAAVVGGWGPHSVPAPSRAMLPRKY